MTGPRFVKQYTNWTGRVFRRLGRDKLWLMTHVEARAQAARCFEANT